MKDKESTFIEQNLALDSYLTTLLSETTAEEFIQPGGETELESPREEEPLTMDITPSADSEIAVSEAKTCLEVLPFVVDNLNLVAYVDDLAGTFDMVNKLTAVSGQPDWLMGLADCQGRRVGIIDSALLIVGATNNDGSDSTERHYKKILLLKDSAWGLACDDMGKSYQIETNKVRWRTKKTSRPWLLGTMVDQSCAVIDVNQLVPHQ